MNLDLLIIFLLYVILGSYICSTNFNILLLVITIDDVVRGFVKNQFNKFLVQNKCYVIVFFFFLLT